VSFRQSFGNPAAALLGNTSPPTPTIARCKTMFSTLLTGKLAVGLAAGAVVVTGAATAAYAHVLPNPIQSHHTNAASAVAGTAIGTAGGDHDQDADDVNVSPSATPSMSVSATTTATASATATPSPRPVSLRHACEEFTEAAAGGDAVSATELAALLKAAGSSTAIAAYCAALPVPPKCVRPTPTSTATPSATPTVTTATDADGDGADADKDGKEAGKDNGDGLKCGICPVVTATPSATVTPTITPAATKRIDVDELCGDPDGDHKGKLDPSMTPKPKPSMFSQNPPLWFDRNNGPGVGSTHNIVPLGANKNGQQGKPANGPQGKHGR
jgi:hypothetical protein